MKCKKYKWDLRSQKLIVVGDCEGCMGAYRCSFDKERGLKKLLNQYKEYKEIIAS